MLSFQSHYQARSPHPTSSPVPSPLPSQPAQKEGLGELTEYGAVPYRASHVSSAFRIFELSLQTGLRSTTASKASLQSEKSPARTRHASIT